MESETTFNERSMNNYPETATGPGPLVSAPIVSAPLPSAPLASATSDIHPREHPTSFEVRPEELTTSADFHPRELTTSFEVRPQEFTTSADSFGKFTGLLSNDETTEAMRFEQTTEAMKFEHSTTGMKAEKGDSSMEETTEKPQELIKTISVIPGKITTTQIFSNEAGKAYFMRQPEQQQLTQGQKQSIVKTQKSDY